jgi:D-alanine transaminase
MIDLAWVNGKFSTIGEAHVSIEDRGFQFGDGVYEVIAAYAGQPFLLDRHLARFRKSAAAIRLPYDFDQNPLEPIVSEGLRRIGPRDVMVYVQLTRGAAPRSHVFPNNISPTLVMTFRDLPRLTVEQRQRGARIMTTTETRWAHCFIKAITLLPNVLARNEAVSLGFDDAVFVTPEGLVRESTSANIFLVREGTLFMPPRDESILHGVTQGLILEIAESIRQPVRETTCNVEHLLAADEVFLSSTSVEVWGATVMDGRPVGTGNVGPVTRRLHDAFRERVRSRTG